MDYKEKYEQALARAREIYEDAFFERGCSGNTLLKEIFPELAEFEDERTRKDIISYFKRELDFANLSEGAGLDVRFLNKALAWLVKQKPMEWTEEDEEWFNFTMDYLDNGQQSWLTSLKQRLGGKV